MTPERLAKIAKSLEFRWATTSETCNLLSHIESLQQQIAERDEEIRIKGAILVGNLEQISRMKAALLQAAERFEEMATLPQDTFYTQETNEAHAKRCRDAAEEGR